MASIAEVWLQGNLTASPEMRQSTKGTAVVNFRVAVNHYVGTDEAGERQEEVSYFNVVVFGKQCATIMEYIHKGDGVSVAGRLRQSRWTDKEGQNRDRVEIVARVVNFGQKAKGARQERVNVALTQAQVVGDMAGQAPLVGDMIGAAPF